MCHRFPVFPEIIGCCVATLGIMESTLRRAAANDCRTPIGLVTNSTLTGKSECPTMPGKYIDRTQKQACLYNWRFKGLEFLSKLKLEFAQQAA